MAEQGRQGRITERKRREADSAKEAVLALAKAVKGYAIYPPSNPMNLKFFRDLSERLSCHFESFGDLQLDIDRSTMTCAGIVVYDVPDPRESLAFRLCDQGIRTLVLRDGIGVEEIRGTVRAFGRSRSEHEDSDIVTELWASDCPHVQFVLAEEGSGVSMIDLGVRVDDEESRRRGLRRAMAEEPGRYGGHPQELPGTPQDLLVPSEGELAGLRESVRAEESRDVVEDAAAILRAILGGEREEESFLLFLGMVSHLCRDLLIAGNIAQAGRLSSILTDLAAGEEVPGAWKEALLETRAGILTGEVVEALGRTVDRQGEASRQGLQDMVLTLGSDAVGHLCGLLGASQKRETRELLLDILVEAGRESPEVFFGFLEDSRWYLVRNMIHILRRTGSDVATERILGAAHHADERVRKEVLLSIADVPGEQVSECLMGLLEDRSAEVKVGAARALAGRGDRRGAARLREAIEGPSFREKTLEERQSILEAYGALDPESAVPLCRDMLSRRRWFGKSREQEDAVCAIAGLCSAGTDDAKELLRDAQVTKRGEAALLATRALESLLRDRRGEDR